MVNKIKTVKVSESVLTACLNIIRKCYKTDTTKSVGEWVQDDSFPAAYYELERIIRESSQGDAKSYVKDDKLIIEVDSNYFINSADTMLNIKIKDENEMLEYISGQVEADEDDSDFNRFIDSVLENALENGEEWLEYNE